MAQKLDKGQMLIPWQNETLDTGISQLMLDRYDVRHLLLDDIYVTFRKRKRDLETVHQEAAFDLERYADLDSKEEDFLYKTDDPEDRAAYIEEQKRRLKKQRTMEFRQDKTNHYHYDYDTCDNNPPTLAEQSQVTQKVAQHYGIPLSSSIDIPSNNKDPYAIDLIDQTAQTIIQQVTTTRPLNVCQIQFQVRHCQDPQYDFLGKQHVFYPFYQRVLHYYQRQTEGPSLKVSPKPGISSLVDYGSSSDSEEVEQHCPSRQDIILPSSDLISIIDKTAGTIAKVGLDFEQKIQQLRKNDPTFDFLKCHHIYYPYYKRKLAELSSSLSH